MKYFASPLLICLMGVNAGFCAYLPVVDVSRGGISARAAFGEEIVQNKSVNIEQNKTTKKVVARATKAKNDIVAPSNGDVLNPNRPSSDLWAQNSDVPLRMPRMDEIAVINSDAQLPEESLDNGQLYLAQNVEPKLLHDDALNELKQLRAEIAKLSAAQKETESKIARARPVAVRTPIAGDTNVKPKQTGNDSLVNVRREIVSVDDKSDVTSRSATSKIAEPKFTSVKEMSKMTPNELKKAFKKTYLSENKHLSTYQIDDRYDVNSDMSVNIEGFNASRDLSEMDGGVRPMEIKISFLNGDSGLSRDNYRLLSETASIVVNNPKRAIQVAIPETATRNKDVRKLAARRLAIVEQVLRDTGVAEQRIVPVLSQRDDDVFVLRIISGDVFESLTQQKRNMFGDSVSKKTYKSMSW